MSQTYDIQMNMLTGEDYKEATYYIDSKGGFNKDSKPYETLAVAMKKWKKIFKSPDEWKRGWISSEQFQAVLIKMVYELW